MSKLIDVRVELSCRCPECNGTGWITNSAFCCGNPSRIDASEPEALVCSLCNEEGRIQIELPLVKLAGLLRELAR